MIHVLVPSYNCGEWIDRCLFSIRRQLHAPAQVLVIDDASDDPDYGPVCAASCANNSARYHRNAVNLKCPHNLRVGIDLLNPDPEDVIFLVDGDDFLPHEYVFGYLAEVYSDPDVWVTYGQYRPHPRDTGQTLAKAFPGFIDDERGYRREANFYNHPLTFRKFLWDGVADEDLQRHDGTWFDTCYDRLIMIPMLEMAGPEHYRFLNSVLYCYNALNPLSEANLTADPTVQQIVSRPKKDVLVR